MGNQRLGSNKLMAKMIPRRSGYAHAELELELQPTSDGEGCSPGSEPDFALRAETEFMERMRLGPRSPAQVPPWSVT
jgi:hypothetical protein